MVREHEWRRRYRDDGARSLPSYEEYLRFGRYSIGGPPHVWAALITTEDASTPAHLAHLRPMEEMASTCIRLANDLQSATKEIAESKINALVLLTQRAMGTTAAEANAYRLAEDHVRADIDAGLDGLERFQAMARTATGRPESAIADIARFVCDFYTTHDYHTFTLAARS